MTGPHQLSETEIAGVYHAIHPCRDTRGLYRKPIHPEQLARLIDAAHRAPSVGFMQRWRFKLDQCAATF